MKALYLCIGIMFFGLGTIGAFFPVLPTTPFLLLASFFFSMSSERYNRWFHSTKLYQKFLKDFEETRSLTLKQKFSLLIPVTILLICVYRFTSIPYVKYFIFALIPIKYYYFIFKIKTISARPRQKNGVKLNTALMDGDVKD